MKNEQKPLSLKKNILLNSSYQLLTVITPFITAPYVSRVLGVENIGINSYLHSILYLFTMFSMLGTSIYGSREISRTRDNKEQNSKLFFEIEIIILFSTSIVILFWVIYTIFFAEYKLYCSLLTLSIISTIFNIHWFYNGLELFKYTVTRNAIVKIIVIVLILTTVKTPEHLYRLILLNTISDLLGNISMWFPLKKFLVKVDRKNLVFWPHLKESIIYFVPTIAGSIYQILDKTLIGLLTTGFSENGYYEQTGKILSMVKALCYSSITSVMGSRLAYLFSRNNMEEIKSKIIKSIDLIMTLSIGACFGLFFVIPDFVPIFFGSGFEKTITLTQILCFTIIIIGLSVCLCNLYFIPAGLRKKSIYFEIIGAVVNLILNLILIPKLESIGAAIGTIIAELIIAFLYVYNTRHLISFLTFIKVIYKKLIAALFMSVTLYFLAKINVNIYVKIILEVLPGTMVYLVSLIILKDETVINLIKTFREKLNWKKKSQY